MTQTLVAPQTWQVSVASSSGSWVRKVSETAEQHLLHARGSLLLHTGFSSACLNELIQPWRLRQSWSKRLLHSENKMSYGLEDICIMFETSTQTEDLKRLEKSTFVKKTWVDFWMFEVFFTAFFDLNVTAGFVFYLLCVTGYTSGKFCSLIQIILWF